jgi:hypothetical protein
LQRTEEIRAFGFSPDGATFVVGTASAEDATRAGTAMSLPDCG